MSERHDSTPVGSNASWLLAMCSKRRMSFPSNKVAAPNKPLACCTVLLHRSGSPATPVRPLVKGKRRAVRTRHNGLRSASLSINTKRQPINRVAYAPHISTQRFDPASHQRSAPGESRRCSLPGPDRPGQRGRSILRIGGSRPIRQAVAGSEPAAALRQHAAAIESSCQSAAMAMGWFVSGRPTKRKVTH